MCTHTYLHTNMYTQVPLVEWGMDPPPLNREHKDGRNGTALWHKASEDGEDHEAAEAPSFSAGTLSLVVPSSSAVPVPSRSSSGPGCPSPLLTALPW